MVNPLEKCILHFSPFEPPGTKVSAVEYNGVLCSAQNCCGTMTQVDFYTSPLCFGRLKTFIDATSADRLPDLNKALKFMAVLWVEQYHPTSEWAMGNDTGLWDVAVDELLNRCSVA